MVNLKKKQKAESLSQLIKESPNFILLQLGRISHQKLEEIRKALSDKGKLKVIKNSLFEKAFNKLLAKNSLFRQIKNNFLPLKNQNAVVIFKKDWSEGLRTIDKYLKKDYQLKFNFGYLDNQICDEASLEKIAGLPEKNTLLAQFISRLKAPLARLSYTLKYPLTKVVYILQNKKIVNN